MSAPSDKFHTNELPRIAITIGDAAGIGPEIVVKALADEHLASRCRPIIVGDRNVIQASIESAKLDLDIESLEIFDVQSLSGTVEPGVLSADAGRAAGRYKEYAVGLW